MIHAAASVRNQPHSPLDNSNTKFDSMRLLRGAPPGRVNKNFKKHSQKTYFLGARKLLCERACDRQEAHRRLREEETGTSVQHHDLRRVRLPLQALRRRRRQKLQVLESTVDRGLREENLTSELRSENVFV